MDLKLGPAIKLCHHIERIKFAFYEQFANWEGQAGGAGSLKHSKPFALLSRWLQSSWGCGPCKCWLAFFALSGKEDMHWGSAYSTKMALLQWKYRLLLGRLQFAKVVRKQLWISMNGKTEWSGQHLFGSLHSVPSHCRLNFVLEERGHSFKSALTWDCA